MGITKKFRLYQQRAKHAEGTKFYATFALYAGDRHATVTHWGKVGVGRTPRLGGQTQFFPTVTQAKKKRDEKSGRGYGPWEQQAFETDTLEEFLLKCRELFPNDRMVQITSALALDKLDELNPEDDDLAPPVNATPEPDRGEIWGSW